jgi:hypothetical protein
VILQGVLGARSVAKALVAAPVCCFPCRHTPAFCGVLPRPLMSVCLGGGRGQTAIQARLARAMHRRAPVRAFALQSACSPRVTLTCVCVCVCVCVSCNGQAVPQASGALVRHRCAPVCPQRMRALCDVAESLRTNRLCGWHLQWRCWRDQQQRLHSYATIRPAPISLPLLLLSRLAAKY